MHVHTPYENILALSWVSITPFYLTAPYPPPIYSILSASFLPLFSPPPTFSQALWNITERVLLLLSDKCCSDTACTRVQSNLPYARILRTALADPHTALMRELYLAPPRGCTHVISGNRMAIRTTTPLQFAGRQALTTTHTPRREGFNSTSHRSPSPLFEQCQCSVAQPHGWM